MYSLVLKNATVIDGTGKPRDTFDIAVQGNEIVNISKNISANAQTILDVKGLIVAPGFIDIQNHSDAYWQIFDNPSLDSLTTQGFTTIVTGNCGASLAPLLSPDALLSIQKWHSTEGLNVNWQTFEEYLEVLSKNNFACNIATLVGYSTLRRGVIGDAVRGLSEQELMSIKKVLEQCLKAGAFGMSSGLSYAHEIIISEIELYELAKIIHSYGSLLSIHLRSEGSEVVEAIAEAIDIARNTKVNLKISHLKIKNEANFHKYSEAIGEIEFAYQQGSSLHFDAYPYDTTLQALYSYLPKWAIEGGRNATLKHFNDPIQRNKILTYLNNSEVKFSNLLVASTTNKMNFSGKTISQIAKNLEVSSEQAVLHLIHNGGSEVLVFEQNLDPDQVYKFLSHPLSIVASDGAGFNISEHDHNRLVHPRCFGAATKFLQLCIGQNLIPLEQAIYKLTLAPAKLMGIKNRGEITIGNFADFAIFDPEKISDKATYQNPYQYSQGMQYVFVNGQAVISEGKITKSLPGLVLKKD